MTMLKTLYQSRDAIIQASRNFALTVPHSQKQLQIDALRIESALGLVGRLDEVVPSGVATLGQVFTVKFLRESVTFSYVLDVERAFPFLRAIDPASLLPRIEGDYATISIAFKAASVS